MAMNESPNYKKFSFTLSSIDFLQLLDGLSSRQEAWAKTAAWHRGEFTEPFFMVEESSDEEEAQAIADHYADILESLREQRDKQRAEQAN